MQLDFIELIKEDAVIAKMNTNIVASPYLSKYNSRQLNTVLSLFLSEVNNSNLDNDGMVNLLKKKISDNYTLEVCEKNIKEASNQYIYGRIKSKKLHNQILEVLVIYQIKNKVKLKFIAYSNELNYFDTLFNLYSKVTLIGNQSKELMMQKIINLIQKANLTKDITIIYQNKD